MTAPSDAPQPCDVGWRITHESDPDWQTRCPQPAPHKLVVEGPEGTEEDDLVLHLCTKHIHDERVIAACLASAGP